MLAEGSAVGTVRRRHRFARAALGHAVRWEAVAVNPAAEARVEGDAAVRAGEDLPPMVDVWAAIARIGHERLRVTATLAAATGARRGELAYLRWRDVDMATGVMRFHGSMAVVKGGLVRKATKKKRPKVVTLDPVAVADLRRAACCVQGRSVGAGRRARRRLPGRPGPERPSGPVAP